MVTNDSADERANPLTEFQNKDAQTRRSILFGFGDSSNDDKIKKTRKLLNKLLESTQVSDMGSPMLKTMLLALSDVGCVLNPEKNICIEYCDPKSGMVGAFDSANNQIVLCQNQLDKMLTGHGKMETMKHVLTHELVHTFDHCRAKADFYDNPKHLMCSEIRAASLSGECMIKHQTLDATFSGFKNYHQKCVMKQALSSFRQRYPDMEGEKVGKLFSEVFPTCYNDHEPHDRLPLTSKHAELSYKSYLTRNRYASAFF